MLIKNLNVFFAIRAIQTTARHGKSNVSGNICDFKGSLKVLKVYEITENYDFPGQATLFGEYEFFEDSSQNHVGIFKGTFECSIVIDHETKEIKLDESFAIADSYYNRTYIGTWESYNFGAGKEVSEMTDLDWIEVFEMLPIGEIVSPTIVDEETGDIIGQDESKNFKLIGNGIYMSVEESHGGGIIFWNGKEYQWYHIE